MKVEFSSVEVNAILKKAVQERFPHYKITHLHITTYDHLTVDLEEWQMQDVMKSSQLDMDQESPSA